MISGEAQVEPYESLLRELRRGAIVLAGLAQLRTEQYGYSLKKALGDGGFKVDEGTLYPLLRRLQTQGPKRQIEILSASPFFASVRNGQADAKHPPHKHQRQTGN